MLLPEARYCADVVADPNNSRNAYVALALGNIATALQSGNYTCTLTTSGKTAEDVQYVRKVLNLMGHTLTQSSTTITISWANA